MYKLSFLVLLVGCGGTFVPQIQKIEHTYTVGCFEVRAEMALRLDVVEEDLVKAVEILGDICTQPIHVIYVSDYPIAFPEGGRGYADPANGTAYVTASLRSLVHELMHGLDWASGIYNTDEHPHWKTNGNETKHYKYAPYVRSAVFVPTTKAGPGLTEAQPFSYLETDSDH